MENTHTDRHTDRTSTVTAFLEYFDQSIFHLTGGEYYAEHLSAWF